MDLKKLVKKYIKKTLITFIEEGGFHEWIYDIMDQDNDFPYEEIDIAMDDALWEEIENQCKELISKL